MEDWGKVECKIGPGNLAACSPALSSAQNTHAQPWVKSGVWIGTVSAKVCLHRAAVGESFYLLPESSRIH